MLIADLVIKETFWDFREETLKESCVFGGTWGGWDVEGGHLFSTEQLDDVCLHDKIRDNWVSGERGCVLEFTKQRVCVVCKLSRASDKWSLTRRRKTQ